jgi:predicted protein (fragment)
MRQSITEIGALFKARTGCIWIESYEEREIIDDLKELIKSEPKFSKFNLMVWSRTEGATRIPLEDFEKKEPPNPKVREFPALFDMIAHNEGDFDNATANVWVLRDFHSLIQDPRALRCIRDLKEYSHSHYNPIVVVSPMVDIPDDVARLFRVVEYGLPGREIIEEMVVKANDMLINTRNSNPNGGYVPVDAKEIPAYIRACTGLTVKEIDMALRESMVKYRTLNLEFLAQNKIQIVKKTGVLDYKAPSLKLDDIGGNAVIKDWLEECKVAFSEDAQSFGLRNPKGYMAVGIPGAGKTALAEAFANEMKLPFLELNLSKIMDKLVGQSERKIAHALSVVKACAPCVFLIDEAEKLLSAGSSSQGDSGVSARILAALLKFMNDNDSGVYVIMTSNDVSQLPPEFTRAGRLDAIWYFGLPTEEERKAIFRIHFAKKGREIADDIIDNIAHISDGYTGAEIEQSVENTMRRAFFRYKNDGNREITLDDAVSATKEVIPVSRSSREKIAALDTYCKARARSTSVVQEVHTEEPEVVDDFSLDGI